MNEADILASTYEDSVTVYRAFKDTLPNGESVFKSGTDGKIVYQDKECALSTQTGGKLEQSSSTAKTETSFCLFTRPSTLQESFLLPEESSPSACCLSALRHSIFFPE